MIRFALLALLVVGCGPSDRERDCAEVRKILEPPRTGGAPRRYWDYSAPNANVIDMAPFDRLRKLELRDVEVRKAVAALLDGVWQFYSPYRVEGQAPNASDRIAELCGMQRLTVVESR